MRNRYFFTPSRKCGEIKSSLAKIWLLFIRFRVVWLNHTKSDSPICVLGGYEAKAICADSYCTEALCGIGLFDQSIVDC